jgi:hypothetical protein
MKTTLRFCFALALALLLTAPAGAVPVAWAVPSHLASQAWSWLLQLTAKQGICIDPNGGPCATLTQPTSDHGGCIDPNGGACAAKSDVGGCIDPNGLRCASH